MRREAEESMNGRFRFESTPIGSEKQIDINHVPVPRTDTGFQGEKPQAYKSNDL